MARIGFLGLALAACVAAAQPAPAQDLFSAIISVNDRAITGFELDQRIRLLEVFRTPGDLPELAREQLVEERLKAIELDRVGLRLTDEGVVAAMEEFAGRADLPLDEFLTILGQNGIAEETLRDFVVMGLSWRDYIRQRYGDRVEISEAEIDAAIAQAGRATAGIEVLLSEIIIPAPPPQAAQALATAERISRTTSFAVFEAAAREVSALPSRERGGRLDWLPLSNYPAGLHRLILDLSPGEVTAPIQIPNGVALFQLRDLREAPAAPAEIAAVDYALYRVDGAGEAQAVRDRIDTCDDLYGVAQGQPPERLERVTAAPAEMAQDIALALATLDPGETAVGSFGGSPALVMLCGRTPATEGEIDRDAIRTQLRSQRLGGYSDALVEDLRAAATIVGL